MEKMSRIQEFNKKDLFIAGVRYFDKERDGIEVGDNLSYVVIAKKHSSEKNDQMPIYYNVFDVTEEYPVFTRSMYANYTKDGEPYGTKMYYKGGLLESGPCWVIERQYNNGKEEEMVSLDELENLILTSDDYFKDRKQVAIDKYKHNNRRKLRKILKSDSVNEDYMEHYFFERELENAKKVKKI